MITERAKRWSWPIIGSAGALVVSPLAAISSGIEFLYPLSLLPLAGILWVLTRVPSRDVGLRLGQPRAYAFALAYPIAVMALTGLVAWCTGSIRATHFPVLAVAKGVVLIFLWTLLWCPLTEEGFFRGWLWGVLENRGANMRARLVWTSVLFALWHYAIAFILADAPRPIGNAPAYLVNVLVIGLVFGLLRHMSGSILVPSVSHALWNALQYTLYGLGTNTGVLAESSCRLLDPERGLLGLALSTIAAAFLWKWLSKRSQETCP